MSPSDASRQRQAGPAATRIDVDALKAAANPRAGELLDRRFERDPKKPRGSKGGTELWYINHLRGEQKGGSFSFNIVKGQAHDFADDAFNLDIIGLVQKCDAVDFETACRTIASELGISLPLKEILRPGSIYSRDGVGAKPTQLPGSSLADGSPDDSCESAPSGATTVELHWSKAGCIAGTPAEKYLEGRGVAPSRELESLRFGLVPYHIAHPSSEGLISLGVHPTLLCALTNWGCGAPISLLRIYLQENGDGSVAKLSLEHLEPLLQGQGLSPADFPDLPAKKATPGGMGEAAVWLGDLSETLVITEGVETGLSAYLAGYFVAVSCGIGRFHKISMPSGIKNIVIVSDRDQDGKTNINDATRNAASYYSAQGYKVLIAEIPQVFGAKGDLNDVLSADGVDGVRAVVERAINFDDSVPGDVGACDEENREASFPKFPSELLSEIPGVFGDLACYLRDRDPYGDEARA